MSLIDIEFVTSDCVSIKSEGNKSEDLNQSEGKTDACVDYKCLLFTNTKCGEIFTGNYSNFTLVCSFCEGSYETILQFGEHLRENHTRLEEVDIVEPDNEDKVSTNSGEAELKDVPDVAQTESPVDTNVICKHCGKKFGSDHARRRHKCNVLSEEVISDRKNDSKDSLVKNKQVIIDPKGKKFVCKYCSKEYSRRDRFRRHKCEKTSHELKNDGTKDECVPGEVTLAGPQCNTEFDEGSDQDASYEEISVGMSPRNIRSDSESDSLPHEKVIKLASRPRRKKKQYQVNKLMTNPELYCDICNRQFKYKNIFRNHGMQHKDPPSALLNDPDYLKCRYCGVKLTSNAEWCDHEKSHNERTPYQCTYCPKSFKSRLELDMHTNSHTGNRPFKCDKCEASFAHNNNLATHIKRVHLRLTPFSCNVCDRKFLRNVELRIHMRQHTGEKPYQCEECGRSFMIAAQLTEHRKRHTNIRDVQCPECPMAFFSKKMLRKHMVKHSDERPHVCNICARTFSRKKALVVHYKIHLDIKEYVCSLCGKAFAQPAGLYSHKKSHMHATES